MFGHVAHERADRTVLAHDIMPHHVRRPTRRLEQAKQNFHQRALARPVRSHQSGDPRLDGNGEAIKRRHVAEATRQLVDDLVSALELTEDDDEDEEPQEPADLEAGDSVDCDGDVGLDEDD